MFKKFQVWLLKKLLGSEVLPEVLKSIENEEKEKRREYMKRETKGVEIDVDSGMRLKKLRAPVVFRRIRNGRQPQIELRVSRDLAAKMQQANMDGFLHNKTIDVVFLLPEDIVHEK